MEQAIYYFTANGDGSVCLRRCFGENGEVYIPDEIEGHPVTSIGPYCFAENAHLKTNAYQVSCMGGDREELQDLLMEQCGKQIVSVQLPATVRRLHAYAFYGCRKLEAVSLWNGLEEIENDAFMNCTSLHTLIYQGDITGPGALKQVLTQISWEVELSVIHDQSLQCRLLFPDYLEYYDEVGPAHLFGIHIEGEGYRARQCFRGNVLRLEEYDRVFPTLCCQEKTQVSARFAADRILYPLNLAEEAAKQYGDFLRAHSRESAAAILDEKRQVSGKRRLSELERLFAKGFLDSETLDDLLKKAAREEKAELSASLIKWKRAYFEKKADRYSFDDFDF